MEVKCEFEKWVETVTRMLLEQRHGASLVLLVHSSPGHVELLTNIPDAAVTLGILRVGTLSLENNVVGRMMVTSESIQNKYPTNEFEINKLKVN